MSSTPLIQFRGTYHVLPEMFPSKFDLVQSKFRKNSKSFFIAQLAWVDFSKFVLFFVFFLLVWIILVGEQG